VAGRVSPQTLDQIRAANDIVDVIGGYLRLKRAGANFVTLCPFHREKSPSFNVNPHRQIFHCFGCHKGGDVFTFVKDYENLPFMDAVRRLAQRANIPLEFDNQPGQADARHLKDTLLEMHEQICRRWQTALTQDAAGQIGRDYLARRGVTDEAVQLFRLGYAPEAWDDTVNWSRSKGYEPATVEQGGLILRKEGTDRFYDRFRGRLIFPICDEQGRVIGFSGRILTGDEKTAKYVNSPETPIFTKGKVFFGLDKSKRAILEAEFAVVCEGQLDLIACYMSGTRNIVAPQGTAFTPEHARILKRYVNEVVLCFDSDSAGQNAAVRVLDSLLASGLAIRVAAVPAPHDPDSFIKEQGGAAFQQLIQNARGFFDYYLDRLCTTHDVNTDKGRLAVLAAMGEATLKADNAVLLDTYAQKTAQRLGVTAEAVRAEFRKSAAARRAPIRPAEDVATAAPAAAPTLPPPSEREAWLLRFLLLSDDSMAWVVDFLDVAWVQHEHVRQIVARRIALHQSGNWHGLAAFLDECEGAELRSLITSAVAVEHVKDNLDRQVTETVRMLRLDWINRQLAAAAQKLGQPGISDEDIGRLLQRQTELRFLKKENWPPRSRL
jgi:DNA primase